LNLASLM